MIIDVLFLPQEAETAHLTGKTVLVLDVLRATSTIVTALAAGATAVYPVTDVETARQLAAELADEGAVLGGERGGLPAEGFAAGNSPLEYNRAAVAGRPIVLTTTNGTRALQLATAGGAGSVGAAALLNARAAAHWALGQGRDLTFLCAGTEGRFSLEDAVGAGCIITRLRESDGGFALTDAARAAELLWRHYEGRVREIFADGHHGRRLQELGFERDLDYCAQVDVCDTVVIWDTDRLVRADEPAS